MSPTAVPPVEVAFVGGPGPKVLTFTHRAARRSEAGVVICSPIGAEQVQNQGRERQLAEELAAQGILARRFHFRGLGDSDDDGPAPTLSTMSEDAAAMARQLIDGGEVDRVGFVGTRLAALVVARAAAGFEGAPLVLWEPVVSPADYFEEIFRYELVHELMNAKRGGASEKRSLLGELERFERADVLGFPVTRSLYEDSLSYRLDTELTRSPRPSLLIQIRRQPGLCDEYAALVDALKTQRVAVETRQIRSSVQWWFLADSGGSPVDDGAVEGATVEWLRSRLVS